jgi:hypothetical protein
MERKAATQLPPTYWRESARPLTSLFFVLPFLATYELGMLTLNQQGLRNGVDVWLRNSLSHLGFGQYFLLPLLTCAVLLAWHHLRGEHWRADRRVLGGMGIESLALGLALLIWAHGLSGLMRSCEISWPGYICATGYSRGVNWNHAVGMLGAGIYEELFFRLMLIPALVGGLATVCTCSKTRLFSAVLISSVLFSAAHYRWEIDLGAIYWASDFGEAFSWTTFLFRATAGLFFAGLFVTRGFGIAVGAHALYDVLVVLS